jgi:hypothetical protein
LNCCSSSAAATIPSKLQTSHDKIPIDAAHFVSPPNALRLQWTSATGGDWNAEIQARVRYGMLEMSGNSLWFWAYSETELTAGESPLIYFRDSDGEGTPSIRILRSGLPAQKWVHVRLPFDSFKGQVENTREEHFDPRHHAGIGIVQGLDDGKEHTLYIDDIQVRDDVPSTATKPTMPTNLSAKGYDRHIELNWRPSDSRDLLYYKIYRAVDGKTFSPLGIQRSGLTRYEDFLGASNKTASYKISAVDTSYNESSLSPEASASTRAFTDDELLTMVQEGCFHYYWDGAHPNAGMSIEIQPGNPDLIAVGSSGFGVISRWLQRNRELVRRRQHGPEPGSDRRHD